MENYSSLLNLLSGMNSSQAEGTSGISSCFGGNRKLWIWIILFIIFFSCCRNRGVNQGCFNDCCCCDFDDCCCEKRHKKHKCKDDCCCIEIDPCCFGGGGFGGFGGCGGFGNGFFGGGCGINICAIAILVAIFLIRKSC